MVVCRDFKNPTVILMDANNPGDGDGYTMFISRVVYNAHRGEYSVISRLTTYIQRQRRWKEELCHQFRLVVTHQEHQIASIRSKTPGNDWIMFLNGEDSLIVDNSRRFTSKIIRDW